MSNDPVDRILQNIATPRHIGIPKPRLGFEIESSVDVSLKASITLGSGNVIEASATQIQLVDPRSNTCIDVLADGENECEILSEFFRAAADERRALHRIKADHDSRGGGA